MFALMQEVPQKRAPGINLPPPAKEQELLCPRAAPPAADVLPVSCVET